MTVPKRGLIIVVLVLLVAIVFLLNSKAQVRAQVAGCYVYSSASEDLYCVSDTLDTEAAEDCDSHAGCSMSQHFLPGQDCSIAPECELVTCSTDCQQHALGKCQALGGTAVLETQYNTYCSPGCCKIGSQFCQFGLNKFQCEDMAKKLGFPPPPGASSQYLNPVGMTVAQCNQQLCQVQVQAGTIKITVRDAQGPVFEAMAKITATGEEKPTANDGLVEFSNLNPSTYLITITKAGYQSTSLTISLASGQTVEQTVTLKVGGTLKFSGYVKELKQGQEQPLPGTTLSWTGPSSGQVYANEAGFYEIVGLVAGSYTITASKINYLSPQQQLQLTTADATADFTLTAATVEGITGSTFVDRIGNNAADAGEQEYGVKIYVDGNFRGYSQYPDGKFQLSVAAGAHTLVATHQDFRVEKPFTVVTGQVYDFAALLLTAYVGECTEGQTNEQKNVEVFSLPQVLGEKQVRLEWLKPCPEVIAYQVTKQAGENIVPLPKAGSPALTSFVDTDVEWGQTYTYSIKAIYPTRESATATTRTITLGDKECENRYHQGTGWETFCQVGNTVIRKTVYTCTNENKVAPIKNCAALDGPGESFFCSSISELQADCQDAGPCNQLADPFGLYYSRQNCYGTADPAEEGASNFCYYDYSKSIVNECKSCADLNRCFEYKSPDACSINNCLGSRCQWVNGAANAEPIIDYGVLNLPGLVTPETGHGYCVPEGYDEDDQCSFCSPTATLFENYYCSAQVCSALGRCFSNPELTRCNSCGDIPTKNTHCYSYTTELECAGARSIRKTPFGEIVPSEDRCSWKRCLWQGEHDSFSPGSCVKDGDGDGQDDCSGFSGGQRNNCKIDISSPHTTLLLAGVKIISQAAPNVTFLADDSNHAAASQNNALGTLHYCLTSADSKAQSFCSAQDFADTEMAYPGIQQQELVTVNLLSSPFLQKQINGETYRLNFYSTDKYHNQEEMQETFVFVDNVLPEFEINHKAITAADKTKLAVYLEGTNEPMACSFALTSVLPQGESYTKTTAKEQKKEVVYEQLPGIIYDANVSCTDNQGNTNTKSDTFTFDLEERIDLVHPAPKGIVASSEIRFRATTAAGASCELYKASSNEKVADFISNEEGKGHETPFIPGFTEGKYSGEYKIVCRELLTPEQYEDYFSFTVDFTPPTSQIVLREGKRTEKPTLFGWEEFFIDSVNVDFECKSDGFACDKTFYCIGEGCYYLSSPQYKEYASTFKLENSTEICYYSLDKGQTPVYSPLCGTVMIEGYGITLEKPPLHYYLDEQWGISNKPSFDWQFFTKVPTKECRFEFLPAFTYETVPAVRVMLPSAEKKYAYIQFPNNSGASLYSKDGGVKAAYVKCQDLDGTAGPAQKMNLEYDPTAPTIIKAEAEPALLLEGNKVDLVVETDDKALCKYSTQGHDQYASMNFAFPGAEAEVAGAVPSLPLILHTQHRRGFPVNTFAGLTKNFVLNTMCRNGAGEFSELRNLTFTIDYSQPGGILSVWPDGEAFSATSVNVSVQTSKSAFCEWRDNGQYALMGVTGEQVHHQQFSNLQEKYYQIPLRCTLGDHQVETTSQFTIDLTPPNITKVDDGNMTCGGPALRIFVYTNEQNVSGHEYQLYDFGKQESATIFANKSSGQSLAIGTTASFSSSTSSGASKSGTLILNGSWGPTLPLEIPTAGLNEDHKYKVRVRARDRVGLFSLLAESDGVIVTTNSSLACRQAAAPVIDIVLNESASCTAVTAELHCQDTLGCQKIKYGQSTAASSCLPTQNYLGQKLAFTSSGWLCYSAENYAGKNVSGSRQISFLDADGDGLSDRAGCDVCPESLSGTVVDAQGCANGEVPAFNRSIDFDHDDLPDYWEKIYGSAACPLDFMNADSDRNGVADGQEDYDKDTFGNYDEYLKAQDPCKFDAPLKAGEEPREKEEIREKGAEGLLLTAKSNVLAWILLILGIMMVLGGTGYLIYHYKGAPVAGKSASTGQIARTSSTERTPLFEPWKKKLFQLKKIRQEKEKAQQRGKVFGEFTKESEAIPQVQNILQGKGAPAQKLQRLVDIYAEHKESIRPGLRPEEKGAFARLEELSRTKPEPGEAHELFTKLKELARKRKP